MPEKSQAIKDSQESPKQQATRSLAENYDRSIAEIEGHILTYQQKADAERASSNDILMKAYEDTVKSLQTVKASMLSKKAADLDNLLKKQAEEEAASKEDASQTLTDGLPQDVAEQEGTDNVAIGQENEADELTALTNTVADNTVQDSAQGKKDDEIAAQKQTAAEIAAATQKKTQQDLAAPKEQTMKTALQQKVDEILNVLSNELGIGALKWDSDDDEDNILLDATKKEKDDASELVKKAEKENNNGGIDLADLDKVFKKQICITDLGEPAYNDAFRKWKLRDASATEKSDSLDIAAIKRDSEILQRFPFLKDATYSNDNNNFTQAYLLNLWYKDLKIKGIEAGTGKAKDTKKKNSKYKSRDESSEVEKFRTQAGIAYSFFPGGFNFDNEYMTNAHKETKRMEHLATLQGMLGKLKAENDKSALKDDDTSRRELGDVVYTFKNVDYTKTNFPEPTNNVTTTTTAPQDTTTQSKPGTFAQIKDTLATRAKNTLARAKDDAAYTFGKFKTEAKNEKDKLKNWFTRKPQAYQPRQKS